MTTSTLTLGSILRFLGIALLICLLVWYVHFQARNLLAGPSVVLNDTYDVVHHERRIPLSGSVQNIVKLTLNGKEIHTNEDGVFTEALILEQGYTRMTLEAQDRFGRKVSLERAYVYVPTT